MLLGTVNNINNGFALSYDAVNTHLKSTLPTSFTLILQIKLITKANIHPKLCIFGKVHILFRAQSKPTFQCQ